MLKNFIRTIPYSLNLMAVASLLILCLKIFLFNKIPEAFKGAHDFGIVIEGLLASILASYIFYIIVVHLKETNDRRLIYPHVISWSKLLIGDASSILTEISKTTNISLTLENLTSEKVHEAFAKLDPNAKAPLLLGPILDSNTNQYANWRQYFSHYRSRSKENISKIMTQLIFLDAEFSSIITSIDDSVYFRLVEITASLPMGNKDAKFFAEHFFSYCLSCKALQLYMRKMANECVDDGRGDSPRLRPIYSPPRPSHETLATQKPTRRARCRGRK